MRVIFLIMIGLSVLNAEITRDSNGIVTDTSTNLQWQDDAIGGTMNWKGAITYCEGLDLDGTGWRMPNINELKSIVDKSKVNPAIVDGFVNTGSTGLYWSSTTFTLMKDAAWSVHFSYDGSSWYGASKTASNLYIRCVRDEQ